MILKIIRYPNQILKKKALPVEVVDEEIKKLIQDMKETLKKTHEPGLISVGLAAPQVGVSKRLIVLRTEKGIKGIINPEILKKSLEQARDYEGCSSVPDVWLLIKRAKKVKVRALEENGQEIVIEATDFMARLFQHEIDHLDGILFFERLPLWQKWKTRKQFDRSVKKSEI